MNRDSILFEPFQNAYVRDAARASAAEDQTYLQWFGFLLCLCCRAERHQQSQAEQGKK